MTRPVPLVGIITGDFVRTGGMDVANYGLAKYLAEHGVELHLVAYRIAPELLALPSVVPHLVPKPAGSYTLASPLLDQWGKFWSRKIRARGGRMIANGGNCQIGDINWVHYVHAAFDPTVGMTGWRRFKRRFDGFRGMHRERACLRGARVIITNSDSTATHVSELHGIAREKIRTIYYGIDPESFGLVAPAERLEAKAAMAWSDRRVAVFVGALGDRRKGFDSVLRAWQKLCQTDWDVDLAVVGAGAAIEDHQKSANRVGLGDRVHFLGFRRDVPRILAASDVLIAPTRYEAYGLGVHEALCRGLPAIVSATSGVAERYSEGLRSLLLRDPDDVDDLVATLRAWRARPAEYAHLAAELGTRLRTRDWNAMGAEIAELLEAVP